MMPDYLRGLLFRARNFFLRNRTEHEIDEELEFHLATLAERHAARGMTADEARLASLREMGGVTPTREAYRDQMMFPALESVVQDIWYGCRALRKNPGFTLTAVAVLALGIGINAGIFSIIWTLCFRPLPLPDAEHLAGINGRTVQGIQRRILSYETFSALAEQGKDQVDLAAYTPYYSVQVGSTPAAAPGVVRAALVSDNFFSMLRTPARLGRTFAQGRSTDVPSVVVSYNFWLRRLGGEASATGGSVRLNQQLFTVIGVMPPEFTGPDVTLPEVWIPLRDESILQPGRELQKNRTERRLIVIGRIQPNVRLTEAQAALSAIAGRMPASPSDREAIRSVVLYRAVLFPLNSEMKAFAFVLMLPTALVLLIACANLANLLLARAARRGKEIATRMALGASRRRIIQQLMTESLLLAVLGGSVGTLLAIEMLRTGSQYLFRITGGMGYALPVFSLDTGVWGFTLGVCMIAAVVCGLTPALYASRRDLAAATRQDAGATHSTRLRNGLMIVQVAVCTVLLSAAGLMIRSFQKSMVTEPGFATTGIVALQFDLGNAGFSAMRAEAFQKQVRSRLRGSGHVRDLAQADAPPLSDRPMISLATNGTAVSASPFNHVSPDFFRVMGIPLVAGRSFFETEIAAKAPVAIVSQATARHLWPGEAALGKSFRIQADVNSAPLEVVGVAADTRSVWLSRVDEDYVYLPLDFSARSQSAVLLRLDRDTPAVRSELSDVMRAMNAELPVSIASMNDSLNQWRLLPLAGSAVAMCLALAALALAGVGMYGVMSYLVSQRKREFGIRIALGASKAAVLSMVLRQGFRTVMVGLALGVAGAVALARVLMGSFYGLSPYDPAAFLFVVCFLGAAALLSMFGPASRAVRVDPAISLREE